MGSGKRPRPRAGPEDSEENQHDLDVKELDERNDEEDDLDDDDDRSNEEYEGIEQEKDYDAAQLQVQQNEMVKQLLIKTPIQRLKLPDFSF